ncbi:MAG: hypothetical protein WA903_09135 [Ornithinimicrobium sp.]
MDRVRAMPQSKRPAVMTWVPVMDGRGRVRMEMRWHVGDVQTSQVPAAAGATAA